MSKKGTPKKSKKPTVKDIDPALLPPEMTHVGPHEQISAYFTSEEPEKIVEQWVDFFEKRPAIASRELIDAVIYIAGTQYELTDLQIKKQEFEKVQADIQKLLEESSTKSEIQLFFENKSQKAHDFWFDIGNALIVCKGLYKDEFDVFKQWVSNFCESAIRPLRQAATVAILSLTEFLAESITKSTDGINKLKNSKEKSALKERQRKDFENEKKSAQELSMEFFATVIKPRFNDVDLALRTVCVNTTAKLIDICPEQFENGNFMKYIGTALRDDNTKVKKEALKAAINILENSEDDESRTIQSFFKQNISNIVRLCDDSDNGLVIPAFELLTKLADKNLMKDVEKTEVVFKLTADDSVNVRNSAAKFFAKIFFSKKAKKGEQQVLYENELRKFASLCSELSPASIQNSVDAHWKYVKALQEFELMVQILIGADDPSENAVFAYIIAACAFVANQKKHKSVKDMTTSIVGHFKELYRIYRNDESVLREFIYCTSFFDLSAIEQAAGIRQMKEFLKTMHTLFAKSDDTSIFVPIISSLVHWNRDKSTPKKIAKEIQAEIDSIVKEYSDPKEDEEKFKKLVAILEYYDLSESKKLRDAILHAAQYGNDAITALSLECLEKLFKWDALRIRGNEDECKEYTDTYNEMWSLAFNKLPYEEDVVREAAFKLISTLISLHNIIQHDEVDELDIATFFKQFHKLEHKAELFDFLVRPMHVVDSKFAVHVLWYLQDPQLKTQARSFMQANSAIFPIRDGSELSELIRTLKYKPAQLKQAMRILAKKIEAPLLIDAWSDEPDDTLIPIYAPFLEVLTQDDAQYILRADRFTGKTKEIIEKIAKGQKLTQNDFTVSIKRNQKKSDSSTSASTENSDEGNEEETNDEADESSA